ncbi:N-acetyltransferase family protein [Pseudoxanthomonas beigongshangi]
MERVIGYHHIVFLTRAADSAVTVRTPAHLSLRERTADYAPTLAALERDQLRQRSLAMIQARFERGLRLFVIENAGKAVAWCWMALGTWRYIDELRWRIPLQAGQAWGRDAYVMPEARGQRLALVLMGGLHEALGYPVTYFSDVDARNYISLRAHASAGFTRVGNVRALELGGRLVVRGEPPAGIPRPDRLRVDSRWLWMNADESARHRAELA